MDDIIQSIFRYKKVNFSKLIDFGFRQADNCYLYSRVLPHSDFIMKVCINASGKISAKIIDRALNEPYNLHLINGAVGNFVGQVKDQYKKMLSEIANKCCEPDVFKSQQTKELIDYVKNTYGDELEFLWPKFPYNAVWRRKDSAKWYAVLLTISKSKLGIDSDEIVEVIDLHTSPDKINTILDNEFYFPGYHMNKKSWYTIILNGSVDLSKICKCIDESYLLAAK